MCSPCRRRDRLFVLVAFGAAVVGGGAFAADIQQSSPPPGPQPNPAAPSDSTRQFVPVTTLFPGGGHPPPPDPRGKLYDGNPQAIEAGARLFNWYNCSGCHFHGAGGMGPALMDPQWRYGGRIDQIHASIVQGRPNGMPSWGGKIPDQAIWEIAAYVRSLSAPTTVNGAGGDAMPKPPAPPFPPPPTPEISPK